jgi:drug/metabolite transporter superfamily protein YnfA
MTFPDQTPTGSNVSPSAPPQVISYSIRPSFRHALHTFLVHHNPFYLLSALCMIAGCFALNSGLDVRSGQVKSILVLVGTLNLYEFMLLGLGVYLIRRRNVVRDGRTLLLLQAVFLVDLAFLNAETAASSLRAGLALNAALWVLAVAKVGFVLYALAPKQAPFPFRTFAFVSVQLAALLALPCLFKWIERGGAVQSQHFYAAWWAVGLLPVLAELQRRLPGQSGEAPATRPRMGRVYVLVAGVSLLAHVAMMQWVYKVPFHPAELSPVLLGLAVALAAPEAARLVGPLNLRTLRPALPAMAVLLTLVPFEGAGADAVLPTFSAGRGGRVPLSPLLLAVAGAYLVYVYLYLLPRAVWFVSAAVLLAAAALFGPTWAQTEALAGSSWRWTWATALRLVPRTPLQWAATAISAAFSLLGLGAWVSLSQGSQKEGQAE